MRQRRIQNSAGTNSRALLDWLAADEQDGTSNPYPPANLIDAAVPASGKKESDAARHVRLNLRTQLLELLAEKRSQHQGEEDHILEESRRYCQALRGERR